MLKTGFLFLLVAFFFTKVFSQCLIPLPPPACNGTEPGLSDNETLGSGITRWYYGSTTTMNSLTLDGGTLVVCTDLTIDKFYITTGTVIIRPGARFVIGSGIGSGLIFKGDCYIYNYGICEIQRNLSFDMGASPTTPNVVINATNSSLFRMPNQYFVINDPFSWFVNKGKAEFWGIITDPNASPGSVCLGDESSTRMAVLINKVAGTYTVPIGSACLNVYQLSQFSNSLTNDPGLFVCLGGSHTSVPGCGGCPANNWGAAQVFTACTGCDALTVLSTEITSFTVTPTKQGYNKLNWRMTSFMPGGYYYVLRSANGTSFTPIDSALLEDGDIADFDSFDKHPQPGINYYMIRYTDPRGMTYDSKPAKIVTEHVDGFNIYPSPFRTHFFLKYPGRIEQLILTDIAGRNVLITYAPGDLAGITEVRLKENIQPGIYIIHIRTEKNVMAKTLFKE